MNITVVADATGKIVGFSYEGPRTVASGGPVTAFATGEGQRLHTVKLTPELAHRMGDDDFDDEVYRHVVVKKGRVSSLVRGEGRAKAKKR
jgi:hypothetical protein